jgi:hypothetical protein
MKSEPFSLLDGTRLIPIALVVALTRRVESAPFLRVSLADLRLWTGFGFMNRSPVFCLRSRTGD